MSAKQTTPAKTGPSVNGDGTAPNPLAAAIAYEQAIAEEAAAIWAKDENADREIDRWLYADLRPLLRKPIPSGFIEHVGEVTGKPYASSGVKSVQVQMDRLDNVLGPMHWGYEATYTEEGKLCHVRAWIGPKGEPLIERDSYGGVKQGSSLGNVYKGSFTNAAKLALARLGPAWEVYVGAADFDPDTDKAAAQEQAKAGDEAPVRKLTEEQAEKAAQAIKDAGITDEALGHKLRSFGVKALTDLTYEQGFALKTWIEERAAAKGGEA